MSTTGFVLCIPVGVVW